ncbi:MAG: 4Fe-4S dicluster domain-containing protein [Deltaproteobacteria bacterium]|nr:4Fe-4S dicluster domain-containing protein [Deltaproteobacteria bacterium]
MAIYEKLRGILDIHPSGAPESKAFEEILRILFTPEEAALAVYMNFSHKPVEKIASAAGISRDDAYRMLESMAEKAIVSCRVKEGKHSYGLLPTIPGLFEFPLMRGGGAPIHERLGKLWGEYHKDGLGASFAGNPTPVARVVPVERAINASVHVHPYEEVSTLINTVEYIALAHCACRVSTGICRHPKEVCLFFDAPARFLVERRYAREISKEEAHGVLDQAEEAGLVHTSNNSADRAGFICNCCTCCCIILTCRTKLHLAHGFSTSAFQPKFDGTTCTGCRLCADERCPMGAIEIKDDVAVLNSEKCIGCGLCATTCPANSIVLVRRSEPPDIPATLQEMGMKVLTEKGKLESYIQIMKQE